MDKILIVDDDAELRSELRSLLDGCAVLEAANGDDALTMVRKDRGIGLVILDVMMSGERGTDVLSRIKKLNPRLPVVMLTGYSSKDVAIAALKAHADDFLEKPVCAEKIIAVVNRHLEAACGDRDPDSLDAKEKVEKVMRSVARNPRKKMTLKEAAGLVCLSPKYLSKIFKEYAKAGFAEYRLRVIMDAGKDLLQSTDHTVDEISHQLGYENPESFVRQFKKMMRKTPAGYRRTKKGPAVHMSGGHGVDG